MKALMDASTMHDFSRPFREPSGYAQQVWTLVARRGMPIRVAARHLAISEWRVERILTGIAKRNAARWT
jgi:hypothetical protein